MFIPSTRTHTIWRPRTDGAKSGHCRYAVHTHTHTHILIPFEDREPTGLKVDTVDFCFCLLVFNAFTPPLSKPFWLFLMRLHPLSQNQLERKRSKRKRMGRQRRNKKGLEQRMMMSHNTLLWLYMSRLGKSLRLLYHTNRLCASSPHKRICLSYRAASSSVMFCSFVPAVILLSFDFCDRESAFL